MNILGYPDKVLGEGNKQAAFTFFYSAQLCLQESRDLEIPEHNGLNSAWDVFSFILKSLLSCSPNLHLLIMFNMLIPRQKYCLGHSLAVFLLRGKLHYFSSWEISGSQLNYFSMQ